MSAALDAAAGDAYYTDSVLSIPDTYEAAKMQPFNPDQSQPWWQSLVQYGAVRAIDNTFGPQNVAGNTQAGSYGGANGKTYLQNGSAVNGLLSQVSTPGVLLAVAAIAAALYFIKD